MKLPVLPVLLFGLFVSPGLHSQSIEEDLRGGLYLVSPDWIRVWELEGRNFRSFKLTDSKSHFSKVSTLLLSEVPDIEFEDDSAKQERTFVLDTLIIREPGNAILVYRTGEGLIGLSLERSDARYQCSITAPASSRKELVNQLLEDTASF